MDLFGLWLVFWSWTLFGCLCGIENICRHSSMMAPGLGGLVIMSTSYRVARILVNPTAAWMTVWPTPHIAACIGTMLKLLCL